MNQPSEVLRIVDAPPLVADSDILDAACFRVQCIPFGGVDSSSSSIGAKSLHRVPVLAMVGTFC